MNDIPSKLMFESRNTVQEGNAWTKLLSLAEMIDIDKATGTLTIRNGKSSVSLRADGRVIVKGVNIVHVAEQNIALDAATIDLN